MNMELNRINHERESTIVDNSMHVIAGRQFFKGRCYLNTEHVEPIKWKNYQFYAKFNISRGILTALFRFIFAVCCNKRQMSPPDEIFMRLMRILLHTKWNAIIAPPTIQIDLKRISEMAVLIFLFFFPFFWIQLFKTNKVAWIRDLEYLWF